ncbi:hypothetical protein DWB84_03510 [Saccharophagus sp. K07]|uniref:peptidase inhibitor family I36 protein n=1 Tax=Saccharophagus sp. K07 TaxID=2283636 RepID=UPI00165263CE|nr:peptidase inhibitor family I36 protein [Saccharophagus sp. K07]MBC6904531.1 hypothetical protein [Saccharophagus sp. K07]
MKNSLKVLFSATFFSAFIGAPTASACSAGYTCFSDRETGKSGSVQYNNDDWGDFKWDNKADSFYNNGRSQNNCLYTGYNQNYGQKKEDVFLLKKKHTLYTWGPVIPVSTVHVLHEWKDVVSSNKWTDATKVEKCPKQ